MERAIEEFQISWQGVEVEVTWSPNWFSDIRAKLELRSKNGAPLPVSETGFLVTYPPCGEVESIGLSVEEQVIAMLDEVAESREWKAHVEASRQGSLF